MKAIPLLLFIVSIQTGFGQDKIYKRDKSVIEAKVEEVSTKEVKFKLKSNPTGPLYVMRTSELDSIAYANGSTDIIAKLITSLDNKMNIPQLNTWNIDGLGLLHFAVTQSYERRFVKRKWFALRVPLSIGYANGGPAGYATFGYPRTHTSIFSIEQASGFCIASGIQPKFYFNSHRVCRMFWGPEILGGYAKTKIEPSYTGFLPDSPMYYPTTKTYHSFSVTTTGIWGLQLNPTSRFSITIDGGVGYGMLINDEKLFAFGTYRVGFSLGTNF